MLDMTPVDPAEVGPLYKVVGPAGEPLHGGSGRWPLPVGDAPGEWWDVDGEVAACHVGLHVTDAAHLAGWTPEYGDPVIYRVETRGTLYRVGHGDKYVTGSARLLPRKPRRGPTLETLRKRRDAATARYRRALARADRARLAAIGPAWAEYADRVGHMRLGDLPARVAQAVTAHTIACEDATAAHRLAESRYRDGARRAMMPE